MGKTAIRLEVEKALADIKYDKWHDKLHDKIRQKAAKATVPSNKEQSLAIKCGECEQVLEFRIPALLPLKARKGLIR